jgi:hypothetical protein
LEKVPSKKFPREKGWANLFGGYSFLMKLFLMRTISLGYFDVMESFPGNFSEGTLSMELIPDTYVL